MKMFPALSKMFNLSLTLGFLAWVSVNPAQADLLWSESFHGYGGEEPSGAYPYAGLALSGSTLYGTTEAGGADGAGTVFSVPITGGTPTTLASFSYSDSYSPNGPVSVVGSTLYGTTQYGGSGSYGTVYSLPTSGGTPTTIVPFSETTGQYPSTRLTISGSTIYGTTQAGGTNSDGTVFSAPLAGGAPTTLANFGGNVGYSPSSGVVLNGSTLYGVTSNGGDITRQDGAIYSAPVAGGAPTRLFDFTGAANGAHPSADLILIGNTLYGTTSSGGAHDDGTVFSLSLANNHLTTLATFDGAHGANPYGGLTVDATGTILYGTTSAGGDFEQGTLFSVSITGGTPDVLFSFDGDNGAGPNAGLLLNGTILYGTTSSGGVDSDGTVFAFQTAAVPEPSNWAIMLVGFCVLILVRRYSGQEGG